MRERTHCSLFLDCLWTREEASNLTCRHSGKSYKIKTLQYLERLTFKLDEIPSNYRLLKIEGLKLHY